MLKQLYIKNYALIETLNIEFSGNLNIITGETGAGKSIIMGALSLILGQRADKAALFNPDEKCVVEGTFDIAAYNMQPLFEEADLDYGQPTLIRREITPSGKSRAFVNDTPVRLDLLKKIGERLVTLHAQHQTLHLYDANFHLFIIDTLAGHEQQLSGYRAEFSLYQSNKKQLKLLVERNRQMQNELDYIRFQLNELEQAELNDPDEQQQLEIELKTLNNADGILNALMEGRHLLEESDMSVLGQLSQLSRSLGAMAGFSPMLESLASRIDSAHIELSDIVSELAALESEAEPDPQRAQAVEERLNLIYRLQAKHRTGSIAGLMELQSQLEGQSQTAGQLEDQIAQLETQTKRQRQQLLKTAAGISANRRKQLPTFEATINELLTQVGMPNATVKTLHTALETPNAHGMDGMEILFSANKGGQHSELSKVASGGELSRLMLCIQSLIAANTALPTLIFDEIDTGISGETALKVGGVLQQLAQSHQVICITHLPQIAGKGNAHYFVYKDDTAERTVSRIKPLTPEERVVAIAKMIGGDQPGKAAIANAKELLNT